MKGLIKKIFVIGLLTLALTACGCTYRKDGSVCQDVNMTINCGENTADVTITLYKTFAKENCDRFIKLVKDNYFNNTAVVFSKTGSYMEFGTYEISNDKYTVKNNSGYDAVKGEFKNNGQSSRLTVSAGSVIMLRVPEGASEKAKYNTAKTSFVIVLSNSGDFSADEYTVIGKIDDDSLETLNQLITEEDDDEALEVLFEDEDGYSQLLLKERDENGFEKTGANTTIYYKDGKYYEKSGEEFVEVELNNDQEYEDGSAARLIDDAESYDISVLPIKTITVKSLKLVNKQ